MTMFKRLLSMLALLALTACGGGGGDKGTSPFGPNDGGGGGGGSTPTAADLVIALSASHMPNDGSQTVLATVTALDGNRNALAGVPVTVSVNQNAIATPSGSETNASGVLTATVGVGADNSNRVITVTATSGSLTRTAEIEVRDPPPGSVPPAAADLSLALSSATLNNSGTETVTATVTAVDSNRNAIAGIPVTLRVDNGATVQVSGSSTNTAGTVTGTIGIGADRTNRTVLVSATSGNLSRQVALRIVGTRITATAVPAVLGTSEPGRVQYRVVDANDNPLGSIPISVVGPGGVTTNASTGINGDYEYNYTSPNAAGNLDVRASAGGIENITTVVVQAAIPPVPPNSVRSSTVRVTPSVVPVNSEGETTNRAEVRALFVGDNNAPIRNVRVRFDLAGDANSVGGSFSTGNTLVYSDANGIAQSAYIPGSRFSPTDGVTIRACWGNTDAEANACTNRATTTLTVISDALSVSIGTDELVVLSDLVYVKRFVVQVNDSSGLAKSDVQISPLLDLPSYDKGFYTYDGSRWVQTLATVGCENEDINRNGVLEVYNNGGIEDANGNGQLDPRKADVVVSFDGPNRTNAAGQVFLRITYPRNYGSWVQFRLDVAAGGVSGSEGRASFASTLPVPFAAVQAQASPAFVTSPYGVQASGFTTVTSPEGVSASLCTNPN